MLSQSSQQKTQLVAVGGFGQALLINITISHICYNYNTLSAKKTSCLRKVLMLGSAYRSRNKLRIPVAFIHLSRDVNMV